MQLTIAFSSLVADACVFHEEHLRRSLKALLTYTERDDTVPRSFSDQMQDLVVNLHMILCDTVKMREFTDDRELTIDLMYRIARGYANSPDLRLTWLDSMATKQQLNGQPGEAAMCKLHMLALILEYMHMMDPVQYMPVGCSAFANISKNVLEESAVSDDVISPDEDGVCCSDWFQRLKMLELVDSTAQLFESSGLFEFIEPLYTAMLPLYRYNKDYAKLSQIYGKMQRSCEQIVNTEGRRIFDSYFRVGFFGQRFAELDGEEFIYKEKPLTKLPEIAHRLEAIYSNRFGASNVVIIKDSNHVDRAKLDSSKAYIQITYVDPYLEAYELRDRVRQFERNHNISEFVYSTPYTRSGRAHGELSEQCKRRTVLTVSHAFPYLRTRLSVVRKRTFELSPIEVALEDLEKKNSELAKALQHANDVKILQMVLQGSIGTTVNQGPVEIANVFLKSVAEGAEPAGSLHHRLRLAFKEFLLRSHQALEQNRAIAAGLQPEYQAEMDKNYATIRDQLQPLIAWGNPTFDTERRVLVRRKSNSSLSSC